MKPLVTSPATVASSSAEPHRHLTNLRPWGVSYGSVSPSRHGHLLDPVVSRTLALVGLLLGLDFQDAPERFQPFTIRPYRLVNSVAFLPGDSAMVVTLFYREVLAHRGQPVPDSAPELGLFLTRRRGAGWSDPELLSVSGSFPDYEAALAPDGSTLVFNSKRPWPDGRAPARNDLWIAERAGTGWRAPRPIAAINSFDLEQSYATITRDRRMIFVRGPTREGTDEFDLYESRMLDHGSFAPPIRSAVSTTQFGEGDPWVHPDREYLIFTRWDPVAGWQQTCDLYIAFRAGDSWGEPVPLTEVNTPGPDYGAAVSPDGRWLYYRAAGFMRRPLAPLLEAARARSGAPRRPPSP